MEDVKSTQDNYCQDSSGEVAEKDHEVSPTDVSRSVETVTVNNIPDLQEMSVGHVLLTEPMPSSGEAAEEDLQVSPDDFQRSVEKVIVNNNGVHQETPMEGHVLPVESMSSSGEIIEKDVQVSAADILRSVDNLDHQEMPIKYHDLPTESVSSSGEIVENDLPISATDISGSVETVTMKNIMEDLALHVPSSGEVAEKNDQISPTDVIGLGSSGFEHENMPVEGHILPPEFIPSSDEVPEKNHQVSPTEASKSVETAVTVNNVHDQQETLPIEGHILPAEPLLSSSEFAEKDHQISPTVATVNTNPEHQEMPIEGHVLPAGPPSSSNEFAEKDHAPDTLTGCEFNAQIHKDHKEVDLNRGLVDTAPPIESVKEAVSKFGGIVDWKAHRIQTAERRNLISRELERVQEEIPVYRKQCEDAEDAKVLVLKELDSTRRLVDELKLSLERAQTEEQQAKQDSELALLRVEELEQGIADESSVAAKAQLDVAKARHEAAVSELSMVKRDLETLRKEYASLITEKEAAVRRAEEAVSASKEIEKTVEDLMIELIGAKECLESAHAAHLEAEEQRIGVAMAREQDSLIWEKELKQAEEELEKLNQKIVSSNDLKSKLDTASTLLLDLKAELAAYMESKETTVEDDSNLGETEGISNTTTKTKTRSDIEAAVVSAKKELEEIRANITKSTEEVNSLKETGTSLKSELESQKASLAAIKQREGMASIAVASLESELSKTKNEIAVVQMKERQSKEKIAELPKQLQQASQEADQAKSLAEAARDELRKAKEDADHAKTSANTVESRVVAAQKEIEAARASEHLAMAAIKALKESESAGNSHAGSDSNSNSGITLSLEEYYDLSKRAQEAEENANARVSEAVKQIEVAREAELETLKKLAEAEREMDEKKEVLKNAMEKAEKATSGKLGVEQELRKWRSEHEEQRKKAGYSGPLAVANPLSSPPRSVDENREPKDVEVVDSDEKPNQKVVGSDETSLESDCMEGKVAKKKKKSFFPRILMFLARRKAHASKTA